MVIEELTKDNSNKEKKENNKNENIESSMEVFTDGKISDSNVTEKSNENQSISGEIKILSEEDSDSELLDNKTSSIESIKLSHQENDDKKKLSPNFFKNNENLNSNLFGLNINENVEKDSDFYYKESKSNDFEQFQKESKKEKEKRSESETIIVKEDYQDSYFDIDGSFNVSFDQLGYERKLEIYGEIIKLFSQIIKYIFENMRHLIDTDDHEVYNPLKKLIKEKNKIINETQLKDNYIYFKRNTEEEEDFSDPVLALIVNYSENIEKKLKLNENAYEDIAKELLHFISVIYFGDYQTISYFIVHRLSNISNHYKMILLLEKMMESNEIINNSLLNEEANNLKNEVLIYIYIDKEAINKKVFFLENKESKKNHSVFLKLNDLNANNIYFIFTIFLK